MSNSQVKSKLAKLLATENLIVEHSNVSTASFNVETRVLQLPIWEDVSDDVYDLLVGHEVGHALYTPVDYQTAHKVPQSFLNVVEDARIERKIKTQYPGISKSFYRGYIELNQKDFFEIKDVDLKKLNFIDRINLHFKLGIHDVSTLIPFSTEEQVFVDEVKTVNSFDEVISLCERIYDFMKSKKEEKQPLNIPFQNEKGESQSSDVIFEDQSDSEQPGDSQDSDQEKSSEEEFDKESESDEDSFSQGSGGGDWNDDIDSVTDKAWDRNTKTLVSSDSKEYVYIEPPSVNPSDFIEPINVFSDNMDKNIELIESQYDSFSPIKMWRKEFNNYKIESNKAVSYLIKEFEMKKSAAEYSRASVTKTGVLNTNKLFSYKWSEDLFKKNTVFPSGKNHGLIMYIDWSGSMCNNLMGTLKQLINLIIFCKKVKVPFQVFAFSDSGPYDNYGPFKPTAKNHEICINSRFRLIEMFNSEVKHSDFDKQLFRIWTLVEFIVTRSSYFPYGGYDLNGTPFNDCIVVAPSVFKKFKQTYRVDKVNTVFLTDGESNHLTYSYEKVRNDEVYKRNMTMYYPEYNKVICLKDPKTGYIENNITNNFRGDFGYHVTASLLRYYKWMTQSNIIGFRLSQSSDLRTLCRESSINPDEETKLKKEWNNEKCFTLSDLGYDNLYVIKDTMSSDTQPIEINASHTDTKNKIRNQFRKYVKNKSFNKVILSKFVDQIA